MTGLVGAPLADGSVLAAVSLRPSQALLQTEAVRPTRVSNYVENLPVVPVFGAHGPFDVYLYEGKHEKELPNLFIAVSDQGVWPAGIIAACKFDPVQRRRVLALSTSAVESPSALWTRLMPDSVMQQVRERLGVSRYHQTQPKQGK